MRLCAFIPVALAASAQAQPWSAVVLNPGTARASSVTAIGRDFQAGNSTRHDGYFQAGVWRGTAASWTPLTEPPLESFCHGGDASLLGGSVVSPTIYLRAALWPGLAGPYVDLHPAPTGAFYSGIGAARGDMQVGAATFGGLYHAGFWRGTAESFVDLHPAGAAESEAHATDGVLQGGKVRWAGSTTIWRAALWAGTPQSVVDLWPNGFPSAVWAMAPGVQVGQVRFIGSERAALWRGTAASFVDMSPPGATLSMLFGTTGRVHVGRFPEDFRVIAGVNFGTREAWLGLHQFLPPNYVESSAEVIHQEGATLFIGGWAENGLTGQREAVLWVGGDPCYANCDGSTVPPMLNVADFTCFLQKYAQGDPYANCDASTANPRLNVQDFTCFLQRYAAGCP